MISESDSNEKRKTSQDPCNNQFVPLLESLLNNDELKSGECHFESYFLEFCVGTLEIVTYEAVV